MCTVISPAALHALQCQNQRVYVCLAPVQDALQMSHAICTCWHPQTLPVLSSASSWPSARPNIWPHQRHCPGCMGCGMLAVHAADQAPFGSGWEAVCKQQGIWVSLTLRACQLISRPGSLLLCLHLLQPFMHVTLFLALSHIRSLDRTM